MNILIKVNINRLNFYIEFIKHLKYQKEELKIIAIVVGPEWIKTALKEKLEAESVDHEIFWLQELEAKWFQEEVDPEKLQKVENLLGPEKLNRILISDRHLGNGWVQHADLAPTQLRVDAREVGKKTSYLQEMILFFDDFLRDKEIDFIFLLVAASSSDLAISFLAKKYDISYGDLKYSKISDFFILDSSIKTKFKSLKKEFNALDLEDFSENDLASAENHLNAMRSGPSSHLKGILEANVWEENIKPLPKYCLGWLAGRLLPFLFKNSEPRRPKFKFQTCSFRVKKSFKKMSRLIFPPWTDSPDFSNDYVYIPLHLNPESSTTVNSPYMTNQLFFVEQISKGVPLDCQVYVKEHIRNIGTRPSSFYQTLKSMPNVKLVSPLISSYTLIENSSLTATITGTAAFEAAVLDCPSIILEETQFDILTEAISKVNNPKNLPEIVPTLVGEKVDAKEQILKYICLIKKSGFEFSHLPYGAPEETFEKDEEGMRSLAKEITSLSK